MRALSSKGFDAIYQDAVGAVLRYWTTQMQEKIAIHCYPWGPRLFDFERYLKLSSIRYYKAYRTFAEDGETQTLCDVGGYWGVFPVTLATLGYDVTMTESLQFYGGSFDPLFQYIASRGVKIVDFDPFAEGAPLLRTFDFIAVMAVLEHYPHSLKQFMQNVTALMKPRGKLYIEVPNIAYLPKRVNFLFGRSPHTPLRDIYLSAVPFIGHHHEFAMAELRDLAELSGLTVLAENFYNYSLDDSLNLKRILRNPIESLAFLLMKSGRECLSVLCKSKQQP